MPRSSACFGPVPGLAEDHPAGVASAQFWRANAEAIVGEGFYFWDELAAAVTFDPDLVALERRTVVVIEGLGATVEDSGGTPVLVTRLPGPGTPEPRC